VSVFLLVVFLFQGMTQLRKQLVQNIGYAVQDNQLIVNFDLKQDKAALPVGLYLLDKDLKVYKATDLTPKENTMFLPGKTTNSCGVCPQILTTV